MENRLVFNLDPQHDDKFVTVREAAKLCNRSMQALHVAKTKKKLKTYLIEGKNFVKLGDLRYYLDNRFSRMNSLFDGSLLYDVENGIYPTNKAAEYLGITYQHLYYHMRQGNVKCIKKGCTLIFSRDDLDQFKKWLENGKHRES